MEPQRSEPRAALVLPEGLEAGLLGGIAVALVFLVADLWSGEALRTPAVLGAVVSSGVEAARAGPPAPGSAALYHAIHFFLWVALGFAASGLWAWAERRGAAWAPVFAALLAVVAIGALDLALRAAGIARLHLWLGALAGVVAMGAFLTWRHPGALPSPRARPR